MKNFFNHLLKNKLKNLVTAAFLLQLSGCTTSIKVYENEMPKLILENYFNGAMVAHGLVMSRSGQVTRRFKVHLNTVWKDNIGTLTEDFLWNNGEKTQRIWTIKKISEGHYEGSAADILGVAVGEQAGNAFHWSYEMNLPVDSTTYHVHFNDWMYLTDEKILINRAQISWFGIHAGEVLISFTKD